MPIVGGLDIHRKQITFDYPGTVTGQVQRGQISPADREHLRAWLARFAGRDDVAFALEGCAGWRYVAEELAAAGITAHLAEPAGTAFARGRKRHAKTDKTGSRHLRMLLAEGRLPECWIPPAHVLECRALLELYNDLRRDRTAWAQRIHAVLFHQGAPALGGRECARSAWPFFVTQRDVLPMPANGPAAAGCRGWTRVQRGRVRVAAVAGMDKPGCVVVAWAGAHPGFAGAGLGLGCWLCWVACGGAFVTAGVEAG